MKKSFLILSFALLSTTFTCFTAAALEPAAIDYDTDDDREGCISREMPRSSVLNQLGGARHKPRLEGTAVSGFVSFQKRDNPVAPSTESSNRLKKKRRIPQE